VKKIIKINDIIIFSKYVNLYTCYNLLTRRGQNS